MGSVLENIIFFGLLAGDNIFGLLANLYHCIAEPRRRVGSGGFTEEHLTYLSISSSVSDSVGSINIHVEMGHEQVGGWKP